MAPGDLFTISEFLTAWEQHRNETEAKKAAARAENSPLFTEHLLSWLEQTRFSIEQSTYDSYELMLHTHVIPFFEHLNLRFAEVSAEHIQRYVDYKLNQVSPNTVRKHLWTISKCFSTALKVLEEQRLVSSNPVSAVEMPKPIKYAGAKHYNERQIEEMLVAFEGTKLGVLVRLTVFYGLRRSKF